MQHIVLDGEGEFVFTLQQSSIEAALETHGLHAHVEVHDTICSTNDRAWERVLAGEQGVLAVVALHQSKGRGRRGNVWTSHHGGVYLSLAVPLKVKPQAYGVAGLVGALGVIRGLNRAYGLDAVNLKWPNDIVVGKPGEDFGKVGGVLVEAKSTHPHVLVLGIGLNIIRSEEMSRNALPHALQPVFLHDLSFDKDMTTTDAVTAHIIDAVVKEMQQWASSLAGKDVEIEPYLTDEYVGRINRELSMLGYQVELFDESNTLITGEFAGVDGWGRAVIIRDTGVRVAFGFDASQLRFAGVVD